jgi:hypothetical protein
MTTRHLRENPIKFSTIYLPWKEEVAFIPEMVMMESLDDDCYKIERQDMITDLEYQNFWFLLT